MRTTSVKSEIKLELWKQDLCKRTRDGDLSTSLRRLSKGGTTK